MRGGSPDLAPGSLVLWGGLLGERGLIWRGVRHRGVKGSDLAWGARHQGRGGLGRKGELGSWAGEGAWVVRGPRGLAGEALGS
ncbi:hypothetical protein TIFTF001_009048 [Ficus carica]|uniref:Uncharacterized protein n=1 Tax=Ficus carica TaxID=3494 RepID=A0AA88A9T3_FICCA|nr:hypothetical protein TIFTF001_009048 [Ficus carica]